jgi:hypothetical protein
MASKKNMAIVKEEETPVVTIKELFEAYEAANQMVQAAKDTLATKVEARSEAVRAILERGGSKGPYKWKGDELTACQRGEVYFFRGKRKGGAIEVE